MKVLAHGTGQRSWSVVIDCSGRGNGGGGCQARLQAELTDMFKTREGDYTGSGAECVTVKCPECGVWTDLTRFPAWVLNRLKFRGGSEYTGRQSING